MPAEVVNWVDITDDLKQDVGVSKHHDRVVEIMTSMDSRYAGLGSVDSQKKSSLTCWARNPLTNGRLICIMGGSYQSESKSILRRIFAVSYDTKAPKLNNMRLEMLGICRDHPSHTDPAQWQAKSPEFYQDLRGIIVKIGTPTQVNGKNVVRMKSFRPPSMTWAPMKQFHDYMTTSLENEHAINSSQTDTDGWTNNDFNVAVP